MIDERRLGMGRIRKTLLMAMRRVSHRFKMNRLYYWTERELLALRAVYVMPALYYQQKMPIAPSRS
jgi:hypothetical protein